MKNRDTYPLSVAEVGMQEVWNPVLAEEEKSTGGKEVFTGAVQVKS
jgi:hypothetical protein